MVEPISTSNTSGSPWDKVRAALANPKFDFRTIDGISRETGLEADDIEHLLKQHESEVRIAFSTDKKGRLLYTLRDRRKTLQELLSNVKTIVSSASST